MEYSLQTIRGSLPVEITFKDVKSLRLKVFPNAEIKLSVPFLLFCISVEIRGNLRTYVHWHLNICSLALEHMFIGTWTYVR